MYLWGILGSPKGGTLHPTPSYRPTISFRGAKTPEVTFKSISLERTMH